VARWGLWGREDSGSQGGATAAGKRQQRKCQIQMENGKWNLEIMEWPISAITGEGIRESGPEIGIARLPKPESRPSRRQRRQG